MTWLAFAKFGARRYWWILLYFLHGKYEIFVNFADALVVGGVHHDRAPPNLYRRNGEAFVKISLPRCRTIASSSSRKDSNFEPDASYMGKNDESSIEIQYSLIEAALNIPSGSVATGGAGLIPMQWIGKMELPSSRQEPENRSRNTPCAVLSTVSLIPGQSRPIPGLVVPVPNQKNAWNLLQFTVQQSWPISSSSSEDDDRARLPPPSWEKRGLPKSVLMSWNTILVNRGDGALFDQLPWSTWTVDPQRRYYDAANNPVASRYHWGRRDAYQRLLGKEWRTASTTFVPLTAATDSKTGGIVQKGSANGAGDNDVPAIRLMAGRLLQSLVESSVSSNSESQSMNEKDTAQAKADDNEDSVVLVRRILELQWQELQMELAEWDYQLAVARNDPTAVEQLQRERERTARRGEEIRQKLQDTDMNQSQPTSSSRSLLSFASEPAWLKQWLQNLTGSGDNIGRDEPSASAPYRGATGYQPLEDDKSDSYSSPYDMLRQILVDQLRAEVVGAVLENTSLLSGTLTLGGVLILRRIPAVKTVKAAGQVLEVRDENETFGNDDIVGGRIVVVDCEADEAIAMSLACHVPLLVEESIRKQGCVMIAPVDNGTVSGDEDSELAQSMRQWKTVDPQLSILMEGEASNQSRTERALPVRLARLMPSLWEAISSSPTSIGDKPSSLENNLFPTDNPIQSLAQYDALDSETKARTLMSMSNFERPLPRLRLVRQYPVVLDQLLLPLIDESVRRQLLIRDAEQRGDLALVEQLKALKSQRQLAKERAEQASDEDVAKYWQDQAEFYGSLRADVTQDEGTYSRFLDRDEWYERERQKHAKKLDRKKFGTLFDGIEE